MMLVLASLHDLLQQVIPTTPSERDPRIAALLTPDAGALVTLATISGVPRDDARVLCALAAEVWAQFVSEKGKKNIEEREAYAESEFGRVVVRPIPDDDGPAVMLLALAGNDKADWENMRIMARELVKRLTPAIAPLRQRLIPKTSAPMVKRK